MKTLAELQKEYKLLTDMVTIDGSAYDPDESKNLKKYTLRVRFLKNCILYLEANPKFETLKGCLEESERILDLINDHDKFHVWITNTKNTDPLKISAGLENEFKKEYEKLMDKKKYRNQMKTLRYLLS